MRTELANQYYNSPAYLAKLKRKILLLSQCSSNSLTLQKQIDKVWSVDPVKFIEDVLIIKIPDLNNAIKPFFLFPYQEKIVWELLAAERSGEDTELLIDKLRAMGLTWLIAGYMFWRWMYTPQWSGFVLSRTETEVDNGSDSPDDSIFGKFRFFVAHMPEALWPAGFTPKGKKGTSTDTTLRLTNPQYHSSITGSSTNSNAGRSRRYSFTFIDECFFIDKFLEVRRALESVSRTKVYVSSVKQGKTAEKFKKLCQERGHYITLHWHDHPWKDQKWYDDKMSAAKFDPEITKEIEVDYSVNVMDQYYPEIRQSTVTTLFYDPDKPLYTFLDFGRQDLTVIGWCQFDGSYINILECYANRQKDATWYAPFLNPDLPFNEESENRYLNQLPLLLNIRSWKKPKGYFGEQAHFNKVMPLNISIAQVLAKYGIHMLCNKNAINYEPRRHATSALLPKMRFNEGSDGVMELYDAITTSRYGSVNSQVGSYKPRHDDEIADYRSALENLCVCVPIILKSQREDIKDNFKANNFHSELTKYLRI